MALQLLSTYITTTIIFMLFFFNATPTTETYTLSLHDALPISRARPRAAGDARKTHGRRPVGRPRDRKSTRLNSSHTVISYAVFCLKKKMRTVMMQPLVGT